MREKEIKKKRWGEKERRREEAREKEKKGLFLKYTLFTLKLKNMFLKTLNCIYS